MKKLFTLLCISLSLYNPILTNAKATLIQNRNLNQNKATTIISNTASVNSNSTSSVNNENPNFLPSEQPDVISEAAIVMEASTGAILYSKNIHDTYYPASITKILTTLIALENSSLNEIVTFSKNAVFDVDLNSSRIGIDVKEELTMEQCLYAIMLESANEVAYAVAEHIAGSVEEFSKLMNQKAKELGCTNSNFVNPHGLPDTNHYTSAHDMALISKAAINNEMFRKITSTRTYVIPPTNIQEEKRFLANHHKFTLNKGSYEGSIGGKTGYTSKAKYTLVTFAERNGLTLISVIMRCNTAQNEYSDTAKLLDYGFDNFTIYNITEIENNNTFLSDSIPFFTKYNNAFGDASSILKISKSGNIILPKNASLSDAKKEVILERNIEIKDGDNVIGSVSYSYGNTFVGAADIIFNKIETPPFVRDYLLPIPTMVAEAQIGETSTNQLPDDDMNMKPIIIGIIVGSLVLLTGLYIILIEIPFHRRKNAYNRRRARRNHASDKINFDI